MKEKDIDIKIAKPDISETELAYITDAVKKSEISSMGSYITKFESKFADFCGTKYATSCMNGTVALHLALIAANLKSGDEVIVPALTYISTANSVTHAGGVPVFADIHPDHWGLDVDQVIRKITNKTKVIIVVHLYGHPADMDPLLDICKSKGIILIEDAAEAHGATYKDRKVGGIADMGTFSFFGNKILSTGEGGMITSQKLEHIEKINLYKNHGNDPRKRYNFNVIGYNYRMTNLQGAIGLAQVERSEEILRKKFRIADLYEKGFREMPFTIQPSLDWAKPVPWLNCIVLNEDSPISSENLQNHLKENGIETRPFFITIPKLIIYKESEDYPVAQSLSSRGINLPSSSKLQEDDVNYIIEKVNALF